MPISAVRVPVASEAAVRLAKTPFIAAVETTIERRPRRIKLKTVKGFHKKEVERFAKAEIEPRSSGGQRWPVLLASGHQSGRRSLPHAHRLRSTSGPVDPVQDGSNTVLGNIQDRRSPAFLSPCQSEACRALPRQLRLPLQSTLRSRLPSPIRLAWTCVQTKPHPYRVIIEG